MVKNEGIKVTVRFRPMNRREQGEAGNHVCVKLADNQRACQVTNPEYPTRPMTSYFDCIYGPSSTQEEVYKYSGEPLVKAMLDGYNATLFAYGQTGSGKTFSMMGVLGTEMRGIQPRVIEDLFDHIENLPEGCEDEYTVQISMCEIYLEKIRDLFNPVMDNLPVKQNAKQGIYIDGAVEKYCATACEVLDAMEAGFFNRATSSTKMNAESSRSHCVTILKVTKRLPDGSTVVSKLKMVDLAGSEKTKKTEATGMRLREAQCINQSLTALSQVLNVLTKGDPTAFVPFRNSKLTRLLEDALGGNSKTSLIVAASPCSFNVEETISSLRFGERAKKVKCKAVINKELSLGEYKKQLAKLTKENEALTDEVELLKKREAAVFGLLSEHGYADQGRQLVEAIKLGDEEDEKVDMGDLSFSAVSGEVFEINKKTGTVLAGSGAFADSDKNSRARQRQAEIERKKQEAMENEKIATMAANLIRKGDYAGLAEVLEGKVAIGGGASNEALLDLEDQVFDLRAEIRGADALNEQMEDELESVSDKHMEALHELEAAKAKLAEYRFYKQKVEFLEKESEMQYKRLKDQENLIDTNEEVGSIEIDLTFLAGLDPSIAQKFEQMAVAVQRKDRVIKKMREQSVGMDMQELLDGLQGNGDQQAALKKILEVNRNANTKAKEQEAIAVKAKRQAAMLVKRDAYNKQLQENWKTQLKQMEQAILLCSTIHKRDRKSFGEQLKQKDEQIEKLKAYVSTLTQNRQPKNSSAVKIVGGRRNKKPVRSIRKKRRPSKTVQSSSGEAGEAATA